MKFQCAHYVTNPDEILCHEVLVGMRAEQLTLLARCTQRQIGAVGEIE
jgi:hypothetical protein